MKNFESRMAASGKRSWWNKNGYKVNRVILWPLWVTIKLNEKYKTRQQPNFKRIKKYLDKYLPERARGYWDKKLNGFGIIERDWDNEYLLIDSTNLIFYRHSRAYKYCQRHKKTIQEYIFNEYQIDGFTKLTIEKDMEWFKDNIIIRNVDRTPNMIFFQKS